MNKQELIAKIVKDTGATKTMAAQALHELDAWIRENREADVTAVEAKLYVPAVLGVLASVVASYYYLRVVKVMYFDEPAEALDRPVFGVNRVVAFATALIVAVFSLVPQPLSVVAAAAAKGLFP